MVCCQILSAIILILLVATLVIKEHENHIMSLFIPGVILALLGNAFSIYENTVIEAAVSRGVEPEETKLIFVFVVHLFEAFSIAMFCLFLKKSLYKGPERYSRLLSVLSFLSVPMIPVTACLPLDGYGYHAVFLLHTLLIILFIGFSRAERNVRAWFITAGALFIIALVICIMMPETNYDTVGLMLMYLTVFIGYEVQLKNDMLRQELEFSQAKTALLMRQISPHFIFNSLQVIISLCDRDPEHVKPALTNFSGYLRGNLESITNNELIPFTKELAHTKEYLALEMYGQGRGFEVEYDLQVTDFLLPPLVLQPVVENAVRYGIGTRQKGGHIAIESSDTPFMTLIRVKDDGRGKSTITEQQKNRQSVGMKNVRARLKALCEGDLIFESGETGTTVTLTIPKTEKTRQPGDTMAGEP